MITRFITSVVRRSNLVMNLILAIIPYKEVQLIYLGIIEGTKASRDGLPYEISSGYFLTLMEAAQCILLSEIEREHFRLRGAAVMIN